MKEFTTHWAEALPVVEAYLRLRLPAFADLDDPLQDIAITAIKAMKRYDPDKPFVPWVLTMAKHRIADWYKSTGRQPLLLGEAEDHIVNRLNTRNVQQANMEATLEICIDELSSKHRDILARRYFEYDKPAQIAEALGTTPNVISVTLHRLRTALANCIQKRLANSS